MILNILNEKVSAYDRAHLKTVREINDFYGENVSDMLVRLIEKGVLKRFFTGHNKDAIIRWLPAITRMALSMGFKPRTTTLSPKLTTLKKLFERMKVAYLDKTIDPPLESFNVDNVTFEDLLSAYGDLLGGNVEDNGEDNIGSNLSDEEVELGNGYKRILVLDFKVANEIGKLSGSYYGEGEGSGKLCYTVHTTTWDNYTNGGDNTVYVLLKDGWKDIDSNNGLDTNITPFDKYGLSMIFIFIDNNGEIVYSNTRWNHDMTRSSDVDHMFTKDSICELVGIDVRKFKETFPYISKEERVGAENMKFQSILDEAFNKLFEGKSIYEAFDDVFDLRGSGYFLVSIDKRHNILNSKDDYSEVFKTWYDEVGAESVYDDCEDGFFVCLKKSVGGVNVFAHNKEKSVVLFNEDDTLPWYCGLFGKKSSMLNCMNGDCTNFYYDSRTLTRHTDLFECITTQCEGRDISEELEGNEFCDGKYYICSISVDNDKFAFFDNEEKVFKNLIIGLHSVLGKYGLSFNKYYTMDNINNMENWEYKDQFLDGRTFEFLLDKNYGTPIRLNPNITVYIQARVNSIGERKGARHYKFIISNDEGVFVTTKISDLINAGLKCHFEEEIGNNYYLYSLSSRNTYPELRFIARGDGEDNITPILDDLVGNDMEVLCDNVVIIGDNGRKCNAFNAISGKLILKRGQTAARIAPLMGDRCLSLFGNGDYGNINGKLYYELSSGKFFNSTDEYLTSMGDDDRNDMYLKCNTPLGNNIYLLKLSNNLVNIATCDSNGRMQLLSERWYDMVNVEGLNKECRIVMLYGETYRSMFDVTNGKFIFNSDTHYGIEVDGDPQSLIFQLKREGEKRPYCCYDILQGGSTFDGLEDLINSRVDNGIMFSDDLYKMKEYSYGEKKCYALKIGVYFYLYDETKKSLISGKFYNIRPIIEDVMIEGYVLCNFDGRDRSNYLYDAQIIYDIDKGEIIDDFEFDINRTELVEYHCYNFQSHDGYNLFLNADDRTTYDTLEEMLSAYYASKGGFSEEVTTNHCSHIGNDYYLIFVGKGAKEKVNIIRKGDSTFKNNVFMHDYEMWALNGDKFVALYTSSSGGANDSITLTYFNLFIPKIGRSLFDMPLREANVSDNGEGQLVIKYDGEEYLFDYNEMKWVE